MFKQIVVKQDSHIVRTCLVLLLFSLFALEISAAGQAPNTREKIQARIDRVVTDPEMRAKVIAEGRGQAVICASCHGEDGNSKRPEIPNLSDQDPSYLLDQIEKFIDGSRVDYTLVMQRLTRSFSEQEKVALVTYFASVALNRPNTGVTPNEQAELLYKARCASCHGSDGRHKHGYARIAGQQQVYVEKTLKNFRDGKKDRTSAVMTGVTKGLTDADISLLAEYIRIM